MVEQVVKKGTFMDDELISWDDVWNDDPNAFSGFISQRKDSFYSQKNEEPISFPSAKKDVQKPAGLARDFYPSEFAQWNPSLSLKQDDVPDKTVANNLYLDDTERPPFPYVVLIIKAINDSQNKMLKLRDIYMWISKNFPFYKEDDNSWHNSIRHNLSYTHIFKKVQGTSGDGKGAYWVVDNDIKKGQFNTRSKYSVWQRRRSALDQLESVFRLRKKFLNYEAMLTSD